MMMLLPRPSAACEEHGMTFVHPFNDPKIIAGNGTIAMEIMQEMEGNVDYLFTAIGGGGLAAGLSLYAKAVSPATKVIGVEPSGAASMKHAFARGAVEGLEAIDKFVDGAAVKRVGELTYAICKESLDDLVAPFLRARSVRRSSSCTIAARSSLSPPGHCPYPHWMNTGNRSRARMSYASSAAATTTSTACRRSRSGRSSMRG